MTYLHRRQDVGLSLVISIRTDTQVDLLGVLVRLEGFRDTENSVSRSEGDFRPYRVESDGGNGGRGPQRSSGGESCPEHGEG